MTSSTLRNLPLPTPRLGARFAATDFNQAPLVVFYETTRSCDLVCRHCRAKAQPRAHPGELKTSAALALIESLASFADTGAPKPILVFTGGDPFKRADLFDLVAHAVAQGLEVAVTPSATPLATKERIVRLKAAGVSRFAVSLDGATAEGHDKFRGWSGSFARTFEMLKDAKEAGLDLQVNTTLSRLNADDFEKIGALIAPFAPSLWSLFFLVPVGRALASWALSADQCEDLFARIESQARSLPFALKTTEAPHYRRFVLQQAQKRGEEPSPAWQRPGVTDGRGVMFVSHTGEICPSGFLPTVCGRFPDADPVEVYRHHSLFTALRNPDGFAGKCGRCEFRAVCGGSRARALAATGDPLASDPYCAYQPGETP